MKFLNLLLATFFINASLFAQTDLAASDVKVTQNTPFLQNQATLDAPDDILKTNGEPWEKGFFIDLVAGIGTRSTLLPSTFVVAGGSSSRVLRSQLVAGTSIRLGNKWYFGSSEKFKPGIQAVWARVGVAVPIAFDLLSSNPDLSRTVTFQPLNVGSTNLLKFSDDVGLELNFNIGFHSSFIFTPISSGNATAMQFGVLVNPCVKFRYKKFAVGVDFSYMHGGTGSLFQSAQPATSYPYQTDFLLVGLTVGVKL